MKVVLFDIDGTLLRTDGAGRRSMEHALFTVFGAHGDPEYRYDGKTDRQITREQMRWAGVSDDIIDARMLDVFALYAERLEQELASGVEQAVLMQGIPPLLERLGAHDEVTLGLLTGNIEAGARQKLRAVDLAWEQFLVNAFGSDHEQRPMLPSVAQQRAAQLLGREVPGERMVIIGDTPADIHCGRSLNVRAIGVATGRYSVQELMAHSPADVFETLADTDAVVESILA
ncbi:haloacid dehalogenase-like hydrolase [Gemmatimonas sp.]|uniref:HAD family hydrolase n=1 Tax=Gemmatimonas sp. TaxID=1962908 RepID=UPI0033401203